MRWGSRRRQLAVFSVEMRNISPAQVLAEGVDMGTGAIILSYIAEAFVGPFIAFLLIWPMSSSRIRLGWWLLVVLIVALVHGLVMFAFPAYANAPIGSLVSYIKIFLVPVAGVYAVSRLFKKRPLPIRDATQQ